MTQLNLEGSADYADALLTARRAKGIITLLVLLVLILELALFFVLRFARPLPWGDTPAQQHMRDVVQYAVGLLDFAGLILPALLCVVIYLLLKVQLVGRLLGVGRTTSAFLWAVLLALLLFPWQAVLNNPAINYNEVSNSIGLKVPGVIYTWAEVSDPWLGATFGMEPVGPKADATAVDKPESGEMSLAQAALKRSRDHHPDVLELILHWARYVGFPLLSILVLTVIHLKSHRAIRLSLGEDKIVAETISQEVRSNP